MSKKKKRPQVQTLNKRALMSDPEQSQRFGEIAKELDADKAGEAFESTLDRIKSYSE